MIKKELLIELVERNPSIGKHTNKNDIRNIRLIYSKIFNEQPDMYGVKEREVVKISPCTACRSAQLTKQLNAIREYLGFPPITEKVNPKLSEKRIAVCYSCKYINDEGAVISCGPFGRPKKVPEGTLCGCWIRAKAQIPFAYCPLGFWDNL